MNPIREYLTPSQYFLFTCIFMLVIMGGSTFIIHRFILYYLAQDSIKLTKSQEKVLKWSISSAVSVLLGSFILLYLVLFA